MSPFWRLTSGLFLLLGVALVRGVDFFDNSIAKVCHNVDLPLDLMFILDGSGSVGGPTFDRQVDVLRKVLDVVKVGPNDTRVSVLQYSTYSYVEFLFKQYESRQEILEATQRLSHRTGTTKTGKALDKALNVFAHDDSGSRLGKKGVKQIVVVVSDGRSHDEPLKPATNLRNAGITVMALGIGNHINIDELQSMTGDPHLVFPNITLDASVQAFLDRVRKTAIGQQCEYLRGKQGAQVDCHPDHIQVSVSMEKTFHGKLFVKGQVHDPNCVQYTNSSELAMSVKLTECGVGRQFLANPKGHAFEAGFVLQYHPEFRTAKDHVFKAHCFYKVKDESNTLDWDLIKEHTQRKNKSTLVTGMPCRYTARATDRRLRSSCNSNTTFYLGEPVQHRFECNPEQFDAYQSILLRNCYLTNPGSNIVRKLLDEQGCSLEPSLFPTPHYPTRMAAIVESTAFRLPDTRELQVQCEISFCDRLLNDCDAVTPPKCSSEVRKRHAGFPVALRPLPSVQDQTQPLVTFRAHDKTKRLNVSRRGDVEQSVSARIVTSETAPIKVLPTAPLDIKLQTQNFTLVETPSLAAEISVLKELSALQHIPSQTDQAQISEAVQEEPSVLADESSEESESEESEQAEDTFQIGSEASLGEERRLNAERARELDFAQIKRMQGTITADATEDSDADEFKKVLGEILKADISTFPIRVTESPAVSEEDAFGLISTNGGSIPGQVEGEVTQVSTVSVNPTEAAVAPNVRISTTATPDSSAIRTGVSCKSVECKSDVARSEDPFQGTGEQVIANTPGRLSERLAAQLRQDNNIIMTSPILDIQDEQSLTCKLRT